MSTVRVKFVIMPNSGISADPVAKATGSSVQQIVLGFCLAALVIMLDQWSKSLASAMLEYRVPVALTDWFDLMLAHNSGAAFSFLANSGGWQRWFFSGIAVLVSLVISVWLCRLPPHRWLLTSALGLVLGGGLGNLWDRLEHGYVVDFIALHYAGWYWPAFNLADSAISLGACLLIIDSLKNASQGAPAVSKPTDEMSGR